MFLIFLIWTIWTMFNLIFLLVVMGHTRGNKIEFVCFRPFTRFFNIEIIEPNTLRRFFDFRIQICNTISVRFLLFGYGIDFGFLWYDVVKAVTSKKRKKVIEKKPHQLKRSTKQSNLKNLISRPVGV